MASVSLLASLVLCLSVPARAQDVRTDQAGYADKGSCTYTYVVPPGSRTGTFSPPRLGEQLSETKEETGRLKNQVDTLMSFMQTLQSDLTSKVDSLSAELSEEKIRSAELEQNLTQELQEQEARLQAQVQNLTQELQEQGARLQAQCTCESLVPDDVISSTTARPLPDRVATAVAAEGTAPAGVPTTATEPTGPVIGLELQVRLTDGGAPLQGRVEVRNGTGQWGSVCDDNFGLQDAHVVCRQLGFGTALEVKLAGHFGEGSGNVWLDEVACRGDETILGDCPADSWGRSDCSHKEDVGVVCGENILRLAGGRVPWEGRVEFRPGEKSEWGAVCNTGWTEDDARVVCRQLGHTGGVTSPLLPGYGEGTGLIWMGDVTCSGEETNILSCGFTWEPSDCDHGQDVQLVCTGSVSVRLSGSRSPLQGRVEVKPGGLEWGTICDDGFDDRDAQVVCRQLGLHSGVAMAGGDFGEGTGNIWLRNLNCFGNESSLEGCQIEDSDNRDCAHRHDVGVVCKGDVSVRLTGGQTPSEGRVEIRPGNGDWGTICDDGFDDKDAQVVCRHLGLRRGVAMVGGVYPEGTGNIWLDNLNCAGNESSVADCQINRWGEHDCTHKEDAGVVCVMEDDCAAYYSSGWPSGVYRIGLLPSGVDAYCDMDTAGGGWTVIQRRQDGSVPFNRTWEEYKQGFGNKNGEYWLGNENIHLLTNQKNYRLRVDLLDWDGGSRFAEYSTFRVSSESDQYRLQIAGYSGTAEDSLGLHNGQKFSSVDRDNDVHHRSSVHCSQVHGQAGWWFRSCGASINGRYLGNCGNSCPTSQGVVWAGWRGHNYSLKSVSMKIKPY
ncbi:DMBT1 [Branchiostoma lanceolatum]|uniref:Soluble scavenger receptor cysteine-rich domain-containing protein SSC5D n=1 Tax=Branchiostoma lanceolatum TaxID=7740 RepID=A0A8K0EJM6_BRALA|nr:DMBT1 [Branchiostoma lanceolatum]